MPTTTALSQTKVNDPCLDCHGSLLVPDTDGSLTGLANTLVPCACVTYTYTADKHCACHVEGWPWNNGHTRWIPSATISQPTYFTRCPTHSL